MHQTETTRARIFEIKRLAIHDGDGIRTTVFFKGCPLNCVWCHNPEGIFHQPQMACYSKKCIGCMECVDACPSGAHRNENGVHHFDRTLCQNCQACVARCFGEALTFFGKEVTVDELLPALLEDKDFYDTSGGGVTLSGGECLMQADFCAELLKRLKEHGVHTAVDTCGFVSRQVLDQVMPYTDVFLYDVKAIEVGVNLKQGYNGDLSSREAGSVGGQMVKKMIPVRTARYARADRNAMGHSVDVRYIAGITV